MRFHLKIMCALAGGFLLLAPISVSTLSVAEPAKYLRLMTTVAIVGVGLISAHRIRLGRGSWVLLGFAAFFVLSGVWSDSPVMALLNKAMFGFTCLSGILLAGSLRTVPEMRSMLRFLGLVAAAAALVTMLVFIADPSATRTHNRMAVFGINPNLMGQASVPLSVLCMHVALTERKVLWRIVMLGACCLLGLIIIGSGSRGAALTMMVGTGCLAAPYARRPGVLLGILAGVAVVGIIGFEVLDIGGNDRLLSELDKNTRQSVWRWAFRQFLTSPLFGVGWVHVGSRTATVQSAYFQVLAEAGLVGAIMLMGSILVIATSWFNGYSQLKRLRRPATVSHLALALVSVELVHGLTESSPVVGSDLATLVLGLGVGLADRAHQIADTSIRVLKQRTFGDESQPARRRPAAREILDALNQRDLRAPRSPS